MVNIAKVSTLKFPVVGIKPADIKSDMDTYISIVTKPGHLTPAEWESYHDIDNKYLALLLDNFPDISSFHVDKDEKGYFILLQSFVPLDELKEIPDLQGVRTKILYIGDEGSLQEV